MTPSMQSENRPEQRYRPQDDGNGVYDPRDETRFIRITHHAKMRFLERFGRNTGCEVEYERAHRVLYAMSRQCNPWGGQFGRDRSYIAECKNTGEEVILIFVSDSGQLVLRTVLTRDQAEANFHTRHNPHAKPRRRRRNLARKRDQNVNKQ